MIPKKTSSLIVTAALFAAAPLMTAKALAADGACPSPQASAAYRDCSGIEAFPKMSAADLLKQALGGAAPAPTVGSPAAKKKRGPKLEPRELESAEKAQEGAMRRFLCEDKPAAGDAKAIEQHAVIEYARARIHFSANQFEEASVGFRDIAMQRPESSVGVYATQLYLESLNVMGSEGGNLSCFDAMAADVPTFIGLYCKGGKEKANADQCGVLTKIQRDIERLRAETKIKLADRGGADSFRIYEEAGDMYMQIWTSYGQEACEAKRPECERSEEILYNAARAYQAARNFDKALTTRKILINPRYNLNNTELAVKTIYELGGMYQVIAVYDEAARWYEAFAQVRPSHEKAPEALQDATILRLGLGQVDLADKDAATFEKNYGSKLPERTAKIAFAIALHVLEQNDFEGARRRFERSMSLIDRAGAVDVQIRAHAGLGRALAALGKGPGASAEFNKVTALFRDPEAIVRKISDGDESQSLRRLGTMLTDVGEARFFFAEEKRRAADAIKMPVYEGSGRPDEAIQYMQATLMKWLPERVRAIDAAEKAYMDVLKIEPAPPPKWVVRSAARVARMHGKLAAELRSVPAPKSWKKTGASPWNQSWEALRGRWNEALEEVSAPELQRAKAANRQCLSLSIKFQYSDDLALGCSTWLSRHFRAESPPFDELIIPPNKVGIVIPSRPIMRDGAVSLSEER